MSNLRPSQRANRHHHLVPRGQPQLQFLHRLQPLLSILMQQVLSQVLVPARHHRSPLQLLLGQQGLPGFQPLLLLDQLLHLQVQSLGLPLRDPKLLATQ